MYIKKTYVQLLYAAVLIALSFQSKPFTTKMFYYFKTLQVFSMLKPVPSLSACRDNSGHLL